MQKKASVLAGPNSYRHVTATELAQGFSRKTLSTALLGLMFASTAVAASAERSEEGKNSGRDTLVVNRSNGVGPRMIRWCEETATNTLISVAKGGNYVWENAPSQADVIPYAAGMGAGAASFVVQRMFVQRAAAAAMERPWSAAATAAGGMLVQYAATNTETGAELVNAVTNTLPEIPEATKEGYATGSSAAGAVALAVDMYDFVGAIKQRYETPATDPAMEASVDKQYKKAKSKLERAEGALKTSEGDIVLAEQHMQNVRHLRATNKNRKLLRGV